MIAEKINFKKFHKECRGHLESYYRILVMVSLYNYRIKKIKNSIIMIK